MDKKEHEKSRIFFNTAGSDKRIRKVLNKSTSGSSSIINLD